VFGGRSASIEKYLEIKAWETKLENTKSSQKFPFKRIFWQKTLIGLLRYNSEIKNVHLSCTIQ
jgi:hypothetical protein